MSSPLWSAELQNQDGREGGSSHLTQLALVLFPGQRGFARFGLQVYKVVNVVVNDVLIGKISLDLNSCKFSCKIIKPPRRHYKGFYVNLREDCEALNTVRVVTGREGQAVALEVLIVVTSRYQQTIAGQVCFIVGLDVHVLVLVPQRVQRPLKSDGGYKVSQSRGYEVINVLG